MAPPFAMNATINPLLHWPTTAALAWNPRYIGRKSAGWVRDARVRDAFYPFLRMSESRGEEMADAKHKLWIRRNFGSGLLCNAVAGKKRRNQNKGSRQKSKNNFVTPGWPKASDQRPASQSAAQRVEQRVSSTKSSNICHISPPISPIFRPTQRQKQMQTHTAVRSQFGVSFLACRCENVVVQLPLSGLSGGGACVSGYFASLLT